MYAVSVVHKASIVCVSVIGQSREWDCRSHLSSCARYAFLVTAVSNLVWLEIHKFINYYFLFLWLQTTRRRDYRMAQIFAEKCGLIELKFPTTLNISKYKNLYFVFLPGSKSIIFKPIKINSDMHKGNV